MEAHHTFICVPLNGIQVKTSQVIDSFFSEETGKWERILWLNIVDTKTIWFVFLLILPRWRVFFLGSPALHYAGTDRLQMVGVRSLHVDRSWLFIPPDLRVACSVLLPKLLQLKDVMIGTVS